MCIRKTKYSKKKFDNMTSIINSQLDQDKKIRIEVAKGFVSYLFTNIEFGHQVKISRMLSMVSAVIWDRNLDVKIKIHKKTEGI